MNPLWVLFTLLGPPAVVFAAWFHFRTEEASPTTVIVLNGLMPGAGLAGAHRPTLEIVAGVLFSQACLLVTGGADDVGFLLPCMAFGAAWGLVHTPFSPLNAPRRVTAENPVPLFTEQQTSGTTPARPAQPSPAKPQGPTPETIDGYAVAVNCTECGADVEVPVLEHMAHCEFCGSDHMVVGHDQVLYVTIPERVLDEAGLRDAILDHYRYIQYLKLYKRHVAHLQAGGVEAGPNGVIVERPEAAAAAAAAEAAVGRRADAYRNKLDGQLEIGTAHHFLAPYRHGMGTIYQAAFGRSKQDQNKEMRFAVATTEAAVAAFDEVVLPAMGKLSYLRALMPAAKHGDEAKALPLDPNEQLLDGAYGNLDRKKLIREIDVISMGTAFAQEVAAVVWRPFWTAAVTGPNINETLLVDSAAASVAGIAPAINPESLEPLPEPARRPGSGLRFLPMECPTCGFEFTFEPSAVLHFCANCHRLFEIEGRRKVELPYSHAGDPEEQGQDDLVPFWEFPLRLRTAKGQLLTDLEHVRDGIDGVMDQLGDDAVAEDHNIFIPAIRCINSRLTGQAYNALFNSVTQNPPTPSRARYPMESKPRPLTISLDEDDARRLAPLLLANAFTSRDIARVNVHHVGSWLFNATMESRGRLAFLPIKRTITEPFRRYIGRHHGGAVHDLTKGRKN